MRLLSNHPPDRCSRESSAGSVLLVVLVMVALSVHYLVQANLILRQLDHELRLIEQQQQQKFQVKSTD